MSSEKKKRKVDKRLHWGRGGNFLKEKGKGIKRLSFYTSTQRRVDNKIKDMDFEVIIWGEGPDSSRSKYVWTFIKVDDEKMMFVNDRYHQQSPSMTVTNNAENIVNELDDLLYSQGFNDVVEEIIYCDTRGSWDKYDALSDSFKPCKKSYVERILNRINY
jgi:hypothetical protein